jgi:hypothetical protein
MLGAGYGGMGYEWSIYIGILYPQARCTMAKDAIASYPIYVWQCVEAADGNTWSNFGTDWGLGYDEEGSLDPIFEALDAVYPGLSIECGN